MNTKCIRCSRPPVSGLKYCEICREKNLLRLNKNKHQCKWITEYDEQCPIKTTLNLNYCKRHGSNEGIIKPEDVINLVKCSNCRNRKTKTEFILNSIEYKSCNLCRKIVKKKEKKICEITNCKSYVLNTEKYCLLHINHIEKDNTMCSNNYCYELVIEGYVQCIKCRVEDRIKYNTIDNRLKYYIKNCKMENKIWELSNKDAKKLFLSSCNYCNKSGCLTGLNGIDRKDQLGSYNISNCVSCCEQCNFMKQKLNDNIFIKIINHLAYIYHFNQNINNINHSIFKSPINVKYIKYKNGAINRNLTFTLTDDEFINIIQNECYYCKLIPDKHNGIDRLDNNIGYIKDNCVSCCTTCNFLKHTMNYNEFINHIKKIYNHLNNINVTENINEIKKKLTELIINDDTQINPYQESFNNSDSYYLDMLFDGKLDNVKKIKIKLEFVDNNILKDIWNFYRARLSSFRKNVENTKNGMGRRIYILIKDITSNKYLGILGISSDYASVKGRDDFIGWSHNMKFKDKLLNKLFNVMMCVPSTIFGYNFCGGKLLAKLCFSRELIKYYYEKYYDIPLGVSTMSIYGKSIQYDRLPELKLIGYSAGKGLQSFSSEIIELSKKYLILSGYDINKMMNQTHPTAKIIGNTLSILGLSKDEYMYHHINRGVYFGGLFSDSLKILRNEKENNITENNINSLKTVDEIFNDWLNKYALKRYTHLLSDSRLIKINKLLWTKQYKIFERNNKYKYNKIKTSIKLDDKIEQNINILYSPESNDVQENKNIKKKMLSEESKLKISESKRNKNKKYGIEIDKKILNTLMNSITGKQLAIELSTQEITINEKYVQRIRSTFVKNIHKFKKEDSDIKIIINKLSEFYLFEIKKECILCAISLYNL